jgi:hypothetical protein
MDAALITIAALILVGAVLLVPMILSRRRAAEERGLVPLLEERCSGRFGSFAGTNLPIVRLSVYERFFVIACFKPFVLPFSRVSAVAKRGGMWNRGVTITVDRGPAISLSVRNPDAVIELFAARRT